MNPPNKTELHQNHFDGNDNLGPTLPPHITITTTQIQSQPSIAHDFILPEMPLFPSSPSSSTSSGGAVPVPPLTAAVPPYINPEPHISSQFYTFNAESHALMITCIIAHRHPSAPEIRAVTPRGVLKSWRLVWKDRNEDTAYLTAWKRIQDKLNVHVDEENGLKCLCFKSNNSQFVSHFNQWFDIVMGFHCDGDLKHLGLKETIERIKQVWTVGAKFYGIPESYIRVCVSSCPVCSSLNSSGSGLKNKRRRFEYTESFDVPAKDVPSRLQQLAAKHKVVLCIRQKYIRYKPFMAEVKDYACHRAGEPVLKKSNLKREPYASKRCGCGFRIRAIVPIANYNEKDKSFVYQEEGMAVFKLYAVHSGHEPGPLDGNARIMHRIVGHKGGGTLMDQDMVYGVTEDLDNDGFGLLGKDDGDLQFTVVQQVQDLRAEVGMLEERVSKIPAELLGSVSRELCDVLQRVRNIVEGSRVMELPSDKPNSDDLLVGDNDLGHWTDHHDQLYGSGKDTDLIDDDEDCFVRTLGDVVSWDQMRTECRNQKDLIGESCKPEKWLKCSDFDDKGILQCEDTKLTKPITLRHDDSLVADVGLMQVDSFYQENPKWYDSPCGLDSSADCAGHDFRHGEIV